MRLYVGIGIGLLVGICLTVVVPRGDPPVVLAKGEPSGNGDVNADGQINIADAVYLLSYLFARGSAPEAIACDSCCPPVCPPERLPATGQTDCYGYDQDQGWAAVPCEGAENPGQDGAYEAGCPVAGRFTDNGDGTVTDNCTGLMWQKDTADVNGDGTIDALTWQNALEYCESLEYAGYTDWRLPNARELQSIVDYGRFDPAIDPIFGAVSGWYWSSSTLIGPYDAWVVYFHFGVVVSVTKEGDFFVRAVRR